ncbi:hypothetical protein G3O06_05340 [Burkholderia sp. Ac-20345]|uniref:hypothetical protein n=1 Tax=Burkholderia sp. Ac-20345 TaxID=2703891 RepID=UPI00197C34FA|nr:hypothetical protein [Burkholderia sp. Ac-20345]MBN3776993.1 hypothetical protein [Burkholderia sp. Ac-20345]
MASLPRRLRALAPTCSAVGRIMPGISRQELKRAWGRIIQPMEPAYIYEQASQLAMEAFETAIADLTAALKELPAGACAQFDVAEAEGVVWTFWLVPERKPKLMWASGPRKAVFEDAIDPGHFEGVSMHDAKVATHLIRVWVESTDRTIASYPVETLRDALERLATEQQ